MEAGNSTSNQLFSEFQPPTTSTVFFSVFEEVRLIVCSSLEMTVVNSCLTTMYSLRCCFWFPNGFTRRISQDPGSVEDRPSKFRFRAYYYAPEFDSKTKNNGSHIIKILVAFSLDLEITILVKALSSMWHFIFWD